MNLLVTLQDEMKAAMRAKDVQRLSALRMLISAIRYAQIDNPEIDEMSVLKKEAKKRRESVEAYKAAGRTEAAENEMYELTLIEGYLPKQKSEEEVRKVVTEVLQGASFDNFGLAMNGVMKQLGKDADGGMVARIVKELWSK